MKAPVIIGIILIALGIFSFVAGGVTFTREDKKADIGPFEITKEEKETVPISPILGVVALVGGIALIGVGSRRRSHA